MIIVIRRIAPQASSSRGCRRSGAALPAWVPAVGAVLAVGLLATAPAAAAAPAGAGDAAGRRPQIS
jgi:hypothetical protein